MMFYYSEYMLLHVYTIYHHKIHTCNFICYKPKISNSSPVHISAVAIILKKNHILLGRSRWNPLTLGGRLLRAGAPSR